MLRCRRSTRFIVGFVAIALMGAYQPPTTPTPPTSSSPATAPTPQPPVPLADPPPGPPQSVPTQPTASPPGFPTPSSPFELPPPTGQPGGPPGQRFDIKIDPKTQTKDLLPTPPKLASDKGPVLTDDLKKVPEIGFQMKPEKVPDDKLVVQAAHQIAKINHMNAKKTDAFMSALLEGRPDLAGLPFVMGDDCRTSGERVKQFSIAANTVRQALQSASRPTPFINAPNGPPAVRSQMDLATPRVSFSPPQQVSELIGVQSSQAGGGVQSFWQQYTALCADEDAVRGRPDKALAEHVTLARMAALTQMLAAESAEIRLGLVKYLTGVPHVESTQTLARMAIFSAEEDIRDAAITAIKVRREKDYTDILVKGLRYPWPAVAKRSAEAITKLERADLIPELLAVLEASDPRIATKDVAGKKVATVRELVKMNHHHNCLMCHAPNGSGTPNPNAIMAEVAIPGQPLPTPAEGYRQSTPELMVRIDVTYLRADFSTLLPIGDAHPWPEMQRFDFFIRERKLSDDEATSYRDQLASKEAGVLSPYHKAALAALREMTGKDTTPTAEAWRKLLAVSPKPGVTRD